MDNFTKITLDPRKTELIKARGSVRKSFELLRDKTTHFAEHHYHLINAYSDMIDIIDRAIVESKDIGQGL